MVTGDGDAFSIGTNHMVHLLRRNPDIKILMLNNQIYGLTKGQASPTSPSGTKTKMTPRGTDVPPVNIARLALASGATFVARAHDKDGPLLEEVLLAAQNHRGAAFVEVLCNCVSFNDGAFQSLTDPAAQAQSNLKLRAGQPMKFGLQSEKAIALCEGEFKVVEASSSDILTHDPSNQKLSQLL